MTNTICFYFEEFCCCAGVDIMFAIATTVWDKIGFENKK